MRITNRLIITIIFLAVLCTSCSRKAGMPAEPFKYASFRDVPTVTEDEIKAVEALQKKVDSFKYGMILTSEAYYDENDDVGGFSALFCGWLTSFFGIPFKPAIYSWEDLVNGLASGAVDFSGELTASNERRKTYFMTDPIAERTIKYIRLADSMPLEKIIASRPPRYMFLAGTTTVNDVTARLKHDFDLLLVQDYNAAYDKLKTGEADAFFIESVEAFFDIYEDIIAQEFFPVIYSPVSLSTQKAELEPIISIMQKVLQHNGIRYLVELYNKGHKDYLRHRLFVRLSPQECRYIHDNPVIYFAAESSNYPKSFYNVREGQWQGIAIDTLREIEKLTGLTFKPANAPHENWASLFKMLTNGDVSLVTALVHTNEREGNYLWPDKSYVIDNSALLSKLNLQEIELNEFLYMKVGVIKGYAHTEFFYEWFPDHSNTVEYPNNLAAFDALDRGEVDLVMTSTHELMLMTHYLERPYYKVNYRFNNLLTYTFGLNKEEELLCSIINKAFYLINSDMISEHWVRKTYDYRSKVAEAQRPLLISISVLLLFVLFLVAVLFMRSRRAGKKLENLVEERTREFELASRAKSAFLANMSHEIRTPMNSIVGFSELALDANIAVSTRGYLGKIMMNATWLLQIINDILDISKIESGKMELENIPFDMQELFESCRTLLLPKAAEKGLTLQFHTEPTPGKRPLGDPTRLRQVLVNLLSNAIKFTNSGIIKLQAVIKEKKEKSITMSFAIIDSGIGMTGEQMSRIFDPFTQADGTTTRKFGGTGLGLSITKNIVELMGGKIEVESTPKAGSKFSFTLTFDALDVPADGRLEEEKIVFDVMKRPVFEGEVLLCEDNTMNQQMIGEHLSRVGLKTVVAENGKIGVDMVKGRARMGGKQFDLIFMDMHMPVMDGIEAAAKILEMNTGIPMIAMTANVMSGDIEIYKQNGLNDCVSKPFTSQELWRCLIKYLKPVSWKTEDKSGVKEG